MPKMLDKTAVMGIVPISESTIYRMIKDGDFPKPVKLGNTNFWVEPEINAWLDAKIAAPRESNEDFI